MARRLAEHLGVLEPLQTAASIDGQIEELKAVLDRKASPPATLIGFSWGAWLGLLFAARYPALVKKLILIGSGPFEEGYAPMIQETRLSRLNAEQRAKIKALKKSSDTDASLRRLGAIFKKADAYDLIEAPDDVVVRADIFRSVWPQAEALRKSGKLLELAERVRCPVLAFHGDHDPHPAEGVREPLSRVLKDFRFFLLKDCGHIPWLERQARDGFFKRLAGLLA